MLVLDSGGISRLAERSSRASVLIRTLQAKQLWPPVVSTTAVAESLHGHPGRDANVNRLLKTCILEDRIALGLARRAAQLRRQAGRGSAVDALLVALAEPGGTLLTGDAADLTALAAHADDVLVEVI